MKVYNENGDSMTVDKDQMEIVLESGWSKTKPEPVTAEAATPVAKPKAVPKKRKPKPLKKSVK